MIKRKRIIFFGPYRPKNSNLFSFINYDDGYMYKNLTKDNPNIFPWIKWWTSHSVLWNWILSCHFVTYYIRCCGVNMWITRCIFCDKTIAEVDKRQLYVTAMGCVPHPSPMYEHDFFFHIMMIFSFAVDRYWGVIRCRNLYIFRTTGPI